MSRYDGTHWKGYFEHDSGLASDFINYIRAYDDVAYICTDEGLSTFNSEEWITYKKTGQGGNTVFYKDGKSTSKSTSTGIAHDFTIGVDLQDDGKYIWVATSYGLCRGERIN
jgi:hypothetical protein